MLKSQQHVVPEVLRLLSLIHVARHGSLTQAARSLGVTTSAVSQQIAALERECGTSLLERHSRGVALTDAGLLLLESAEELARKLDEIGGTMSQLKGELAGPVRVASIASGAASLVLPATRLLAAAAPAVAVRVTIAEPPTSLESVSDGLVDLALVDVYDNVPLALPAHLHVEEVVSEPLVLVCAQDDTMARRPSLAALKDRPWVLPPPHTACGAATRYACRSVGFEPRVSWETDDLLLLVAAVSRGEGIALLPRRAVADTVAPVSLRRLIDPLLRRQLLLVARPGTAQRPSVRALLDAVHVAGRSAPPSP